MVDVQPLHLVRHGQSEWNVLGLAQGQTAHPQLTDRGREQATATAHHLAGLVGAAADWSEVVSSDLTRAHQTAEVIAEHLGVPVRTDVRLRERAFGVWEGQDHRLAGAWLRDHPDPHQRPDGGESAHEVQTRVRAALAELDRSRVQVVVTHGEVLRLLTTPDRAVPAVDNGAVLVWADHV